MLDKLERKIAELKDGNGRAFDYIYEKTNKAAFLTALYIVKDRMTAEDVLQDAYIKAIGSIRSYRENTNFTAWLCTIARNLALNRIRSGAREVFTDFDSDSRKYGTSETEIPFIFEFASKMLSEDEFRIITMCHVGGYKRREVAEILGIPIGTVTWKNNEALKKLRTALKKEGGL